MDESPRQLIGETREPVVMAPGQQRREDYEYERRGVANVFMANEPLKGKRYVQITERKTKKDFAAFLKHIADELYPQATKIRLVMDNLATHKSAAFYEVYAPEEARRLCERFEFIYTPKHGSWLNMAEIELNVMAGQCLNRRIGDIETLKKQVEAWCHDRNNENRTINWQFTNEKARVKLKRLYPTFLD